MKHYVALLLLCYFTGTAITNAQATWQPLPNVATNQNGQRFDDVFFLDDKTGWALNGQYATVFKTTDGGLTWNTQLTETELGGDFYFRNIQFLNENIGFIGTLNGKFFKTINGGENWTEITNISPNPPALCGLSTIGSSTVYGCGAYFEPAHIVKSTDSGNTWQFIDMSAYATALVEIYFLTETTGFVSGKNSNGATLLKTTDGGITWTEIYNSNNAGEYVWKIQILKNNPDTIFGSVSAVSPNLGKLIKSIDGGVTWDSFDAPETNIQAVGFIDENHGWMGGHTTGLFETIDGGVTWTNLNVGSNLNRIIVINSSIVYAAGTSIYKFTNETLSTEIIEEQPKIHPLNITLIKNPIKSLLEVSIDFHADENLLIELYTIDGKYIKQLLRERIPSKTKKNYTFNLTNLNSGEYLVNFHYNNGRESIKFIKR